MLAYACQVDAHKVMSCSEVSAVLDDLRRQRTSRSGRCREVVFRLATCCGLRCGEIVGLVLDDVRVDNSRPHIFIRNEVTKRRKGNDARRWVPLNWDRETLDVLRKWKRERESMGASCRDPFVCSLKRTIMTQPDGTICDTPPGHALTPKTAYLRFKTAIRCLPEERRKQLSIHSGRHTFVSVSLHRGKTLVQVQRAVGHRSISTTSAYLHLVDEDEGIGDIFALS